MAGGVSKAGEVNQDIKKKSTQHNQPVAFLNIFTTVTELVLSEMFISQCLY